MSKFEGQITAGLLRPDCAGASLRWYEKCPRCGAGRQDNCKDDAAYCAQLVKRGAHDAAPSKLWPIASAPQDGTWIIGWASSDSSPYRVSWGRNHCGKLAWCSVAGSFVSGYITHWMPMPEVVGAPFSAPEQEEKLDGV